MKKNNRPPSGTIFWSAEPLADWNMYLSVNFFKRLMTLSLNKKSVNDRGWLVDRFCMPPSLFCLIIAKKSNVISRSSWILSLILRMVAVSSDFALSASSMRRTACTVVAALVAGRCSYFGSEVATSTICVDVVTGLYSVGATIGTNSSLFALTAFEYRWKGRGELNNFCWLEFDTNTANSNNIENVYCRQLILFRHISGVFNVWNVLNLISKTWNLNDNIFRVDYLICVLRFYCWKKFLLLFHSVFCVLSCFCFA